MTTPKTKIFVGHLPDGCRNEDLQQLFSKYGTVTECDVINKYGFVHMSSPEEADKAIQSLNNYNLMGSNISVEPSKSKLHPQPGAPGRAKGSLASGKGRGGGMSPRNGFGGARDGYGTPFPNGIRRYETTAFGGSMADSYYDRPFGFGRDRMRPYPPPYERSIANMVSPREEYARRTMSMAMQPPPGPSDPYGRPYSTVAREDLYERRAPTERPDYLPYSRRTPPPPPGTSMTLARSYWMDDLGAAGDFNSRAPPPAATRRTYY